MSRRRDFIKHTAGAMAGIAFTGCGLLHAAPSHAQAATPHRRREVVVNGRRVKTVDVHAHCGFPEAMALLGLKLAPVTLDDPGNLHPQVRQVLDIRVFPRLHLMRWV